MFRRPVHREAARVLGAFDERALRRCRCLFGGGTQIALELDEFRESRDIDFLCSDATGYAELRSLARSGGGQALLPRAAEGGLVLPREIRADQYGVRFPVVAGEWTFKVEMIREGRIALGPGERLAGCPVDALAREDVFAEKLLANSDRWADKSTLARDLIDLSALRHRHGPIPASAWAKAESAYGAPVRGDLRQAIALFQGDLEFQRRCFEGLRIERPEPVLEGLALLEVEGAG